MINIILAGVGGQGTVLASKILAVAASTKGWDVRTAETIGMAQRGGSVVSHVRIADKGEFIHAPLVTKGTANLIIGFEPGEAARNLSYLARGGTMIMSTTPIEPITASLNASNYSVEEIVENLKMSMYNAMVRNISRDKSGNSQPKLYTVNDMALTNEMDGNRRVLNSIMLAEAVKTGALPITLEELCGAVAVCVKPDYVEMNIQAIEKVVLS